MSNAALFVDLRYAVEPTMGLSRRVAQHVGWLKLSKAEAKASGPRWVHPRDVRDGKPVFCQLHGTELWREPPDFTRSLDAAATLIPECVTWSVARLATGRGEAIIWKGGSEKPICVVAATPALALCLAALEARG